MIRRILRFANVVLAGILAGVSFAIWKGFPPQGLSPATYVEQQQNMLQGLRTLLVVLVLATTAITIVSAFLQRQDKAAFVSLLVAAALFIACILITVIGNRPIDDAVLTWNASSLPQNWMELRDRWWSLHILRVAVELGALFLVAWAGVRKD